MLARTNCTGAAVHARPVANTRDRNFTQAKMQRRLAQIDESIDLANRDRPDR
jgi:hypothetical protein